MYATLIYLLEMWPLRTASPTFLWRKQIGKWRNDCHCRDKEQNCSHARISIWQIITLCRTDLKKIYIFSKMRKRWNMFKCDARIILCFVSGHQCNFQLISRIQCLYSTSYLTVYSKQSSDSLLNVYSHVYPKSVRHWRKTGVISTYHLTGWQC